MDLFEKCKSCDKDFCDNCEEEICETDKNKECTLCGECIEK